jgi:hypothetical protein
VRSSNGSGSTLLPTAGHGNINDASFITVAADCTVRGFLIYYPLQTCGDVDPAPYPRTLDLVADNAAVQDIEILNPYNAVRAVLLRTPVSEALAGPALYARYLEMRGPLPAPRPSRVAAASAAVGRPSPHSSAPPADKVLTPLSTAPPLEQRPWPWEALLGTLPPSRSAELTEAAAAHVRASAAALGLGSTVDPAHVARAKELVAAHRSSTTTRQG